MMIAEEIIAGFYKIRDYLKDLRNHYLKDKTKNYKIIHKKKAQNSQSLNYLAKQQTNPQKEINKDVHKIYSKFVRE